MSITRDVRDTASSFYYLKALETLRERHLEMALASQEIPSDFWERGETEALEATKREFFNVEARRIFLPEKADGLSDEEDFQARSTTLVEMGMLETHRILARIPWVGDPAYDDPRANLEAGPNPPGDTGLPGPSDPVSG